MNNSRQNVNRNPFGKAQTELFQYILKNPGCSFDNIHQDCFPDKQSRYLNNLLYENIHLVDKTSSVDQNFPSEYRIKVKTLSGFIDLAHWIKTGEFKAKYVQGDLFNSQPRTT